MKVRLINLKLFNQKYSKLFYKNSFFKFPSRHIQTYFHWIYDYMGLSLPFLGLPYYKQIGLKIRCFQKLRHTFSFIGNTNQLFYQIEKNDHKNKNSMRSIGNSIIIHFCIRDQLTINYKGKKLKCVYFLYISSICW